jgi:hypothetical protein
MQNAVIFSIDAINDARLRACRIVRLTAAGGIKRGAIQNDGDCAIVAFAQIITRASNSSKRESL